jgi:hypothetical protein
MLPRSAAIVAAMRRMMIGVIVGRVVGRVPSLCPACGKLRRTAVLNATGVPLCSCEVTDEELDELVPVGTWLGEQIPEAIISLDLDDMELCRNCRGWDDAMCMSIDSEWCGIETLFDHKCDAFAK